MKIVMERSALLAALSFVAKWSSKGDTIEVLSHLLIEAGDGAVAITGTTLDKIARTTVPADIEDGGSACIPAELLVKAVKGGAASEVSISCDDKGAVVRIGKTRLSVGILPADQFPDAVLLSSEPAYRLTMDAATLTTCIGGCAPFVWTDVGRDFISGVSWRHTEAGLEFCGTDGKTLSLVETGQRYHGAAGLDIITPPMALPQWTGDVEIEISNHFIRFRCGADALASKLIEGNFPDVHRLIPQGEGSVLTFDRSDLARAVSTVDLNAVGKENSILFVGENGQCTLSTVSTRGAVEDVVNYDGPDFVIALATRVIGKCLAETAAETIDIIYFDATKAVIIRPMGEAGRTMIAVPYRDSRVAGYASRAREAA